MDLSFTRRRLLLDGGAGFGSLAMAYLLRDHAAFAAPTGGAAAKAVNPLASKVPHVRPTAKSVIFLFMEGGPSHIDLFDPKPAIRKYAGKPLPASFQPVITAMGEYNAPMFPDQRTWKQHGKSGLWMSDWIPHHAEIADDIAVIRSCVSDGINHSGGVCQMNTGSV